MSPPDLREAALAHLARFATSEVGLKRVLERKLVRWARQALDAGADPEKIQQAQAASRHDLPGVVAEMARLGAVDDASFAAGRAQALSRGGRSRRAIEAHLATRGIGSDRIAEALESTLEAGSLEDGTQAELAAALLQARRRRIGPFGINDEDEPSETRLAMRHRALSALARAGFSHDVALQALDTDRETAEALIARLRG